MEYTIGTKVFRDWEIVAEIGEGSYGKVYQLRKENFGIVANGALKVLRIPRSHADVKDALSQGMDEKSVTSYFKGVVDDFMREVAVMSEMKSHPNVVGCQDYDIIEHEGGMGWDILIRMDLLTPLQEYQTKNTMDEARVRRLGVDLCEALIHCQKRGLIHRDIKPANIFVDELGCFRLGDFGVARTADKTMGGMSKQGTENYMAPEIYLGREYGPTVDIYSLGMVLYQLMNANRLPFYPLPPAPIEFSHRYEVLKKRMSGVQMPPPSQASEEFSEIILKACSFDSKNRYRTAAEMLAALKKGTGVAASVQEPPRFDAVPPVMDGFSAGIPTGDETIGPAFTFSTPTGDETVGPAFTFSAPTGDETIGPAFTFGTPTGDETVGPVFAPKVSPQQGHQPEPQPVVGTPVSAPAPQKPVEEPASTAEKSFYNRPAQEKSVASETAWQEVVRARQENERKKRTKTGLIAAVLAIAAIGGVAVFKMMDAKEAQKQEAQMQEIQTKEEAHVYFEELLVQADELRAASEYTQAADLYSQAIDHFESSGISVETEKLENAQVGYATALYDSEQYEELISTFGPKRNQFLYVKSDINAMLGFAYYVQGDYANAVNCFEAAIELGHFFTDLECYYVLSLLFMDDQNGAIAAYYQHLDGAVHSDLARYVQARIEWSQGYRKSAAEKFKSLLNSATDDVRFKAGYDLALLYTEASEEGDPDFTNPAHLAVDVLTQNMEEFADNSNLWRVLANAYEVCGDEDPDRRDEYQEKKAECLETVLELEGPSYEISTMMFVYYYSNHWYDKAEIVLQQYEAALTDDYTPHALRGYMLLTMEDTLVVSEENLRAAREEFEIASRMIRDTDDRYYYEMLEEQLEIEEGLYESAQYEPKYNG